jgi:hypothetical protein
VLRANGAAARTAAMETLIGDLRSIARRLAS